MNGCHNRADYKPSYLAHDGYYDSEPGMPLARIPRMVEVPFTMSPDCQYTQSDLGRVDAGCNGCKWRAIAV